MAEAQELEEEKEALETIDFEQLKKMENFDSKETQDEGFTISWK